MAVKAVQTGNWQVARGSGQHVWHVDLLSSLTLNFCFGKVPQYVQAFPPPSHLVFGVCEVPLCRAAHVGSHKLHALEAGLYVHVSMWARMNCML